MPQTEESGFRQAIAVTRVAARGLLRSKLPSMAAALAFRSLFAIVPVLVIGLVIVRAVAGQQGVEAGLYQLLSFSGVTSLVAGAEVSVPAMGPEEEATELDDADAGEASLNEPLEPTDQNGDAGEDGGEDPVDEEPTDQQPNAEQPENELAIGLVPNLTDEGDADELAAKRRLDVWVTARVSQIMEISLPAIGIVGFATLIFAASSLLLEIERSFNAVYRVRTSRTWTVRLLMFWAVLTLGGVFIFGTFAAGNGFQEWARAQLGSHATSAAVSLLGFFVTVCISTILFALAYQAIPSTRVHLRASLAGALIAAVLWEIGKWGLTRSISYFVGSSTYAKVYGALALLPVFMLWVHYTWLIILFGLQVSFGLQHIRTWNQAEAEDSSVAVADSAAAISVMTYVASRFAEGEPAQADDISDETGLPGRTVAALLERLTDAGLLVRSADDSDQLRLAKPAERVLVREVVGVLGDAADGTPDPRPWSAAAGVFRENLLASAGSRSLAALVSEATPDFGSDALGLPGPHTDDQPAHTTNPAASDATMPTKSTSDAIEHG